MGRNENPSIGADGVIEWRDEEGELHRVAGPARVFPSGREEWSVTAACIAPAAPR